MKWCLMSSDVRDKLWPMPKHGSEVSLGRTAQDGHLDSHTSAELSKSLEICVCLWPEFDCPEVTLCGRQDIKIQLLAK